MRTSTFLKSFIEKENIEIYAEVGMEFGRTMQKILLSDCSKIIKEYWAIDPWSVVGFAYGLKQAFRTAEDWQDMYKGVCQQMLSFSQVRVLRLPSIEAAKLFPNGYFDMVYIDGDHSYLAVSEDIKAWLPKVKIGGVLAGHDCNLKGVKKAVRQHFSNNHQSINSTKIWMKLREKDDVLHLSSMKVFKAQTKGSLWKKIQERKN